MITDIKPPAELDLAYMEDATESDAQPHDNKDVSQPAFDQLVLPEGHKSIVLSLISQHYRNRDSGRRSIDQSDIVRGKGKRITLYLSETSPKFTDDVTNDRKGSHIASSWCSRGRKDEHGRFVSPSK